MSIRQGQEISLPSAREESIPVSTRACCVKKINFTLRTGSNPGPPAGQPKAHVTKPRDTAYLQIHHSAPYQGEAEEYWGSYPEDLQLPVLVDVEHQEDREGDAEHGERQQRASVEEIENRHYPGL
jgi:hypothetical protein